MIRAVGFLALACVLAVAAAATDASTQTTTAPAAYDDWTQIAIDLKHPLARVVREKGWSAGHAAAVADEYRRFWFLHARHPDFYLVPSLDVDELWHAHILFTAQYADDCQRVFGSFLHHFPTVDDDDGDAQPTDATADAASAADDDGAAALQKPADESRSAYEKMLALYESEFGVAPGPIWVARDTTAGNGDGAAQCCTAKCHNQTKAPAGKPAPTKAAQCCSGAKCTNKTAATAKAGCGSGCGAKSETNSKAGCGSCGSKCPFKTKAQAKSDAAAAAVASAGCGNCHGGSAKQQTRDGQAAGCGRCHGGAAKASAGGCGNCHGKGAGAAKGELTKAAGCGRCHGQTKAAAATTTKTGDVGQAAGCGRCHGGQKAKAAVGQAAGCGRCHGGQKATAKDSAGQAAGCGRCHGGAAKAVGQAAGCGRCKGAKAAAATAEVTKPAPKTADVAEPQIVHLRV